MNVDGESKVPTKLGAATTIILAIVFFAYAISRGAQVSIRHDLQVNEYFKLDGLDETEIFNFEETGFRVAFGVESYTSRASMEDPEYVEWRVQLASNVDGVESV
jgi:hypothetical protein